MVLETDEPHPNTRETQGSFGDVLDSLFKKAGDAHDPPLGIETSMHFVVEPKGGRVPDVSEFEDVHALLITGSMADAHGDEEWILKLVRLLRGMFYPFVSRLLIFAFLLLLLNVIGEMRGRIGEERMIQTEQKESSLTYLRVSHRSMGSETGYAVQRGVFRAPGPMPDVGLDSRVDARQQVGVGAHGDQTDGAGQETVPLERGPVVPAPDAPGSRRQCAVGGGV